MRIEEVSRIFHTGHYSFTEFRDLINQPLRDAGIDLASERSHRMTDEMRNYILRFFQMARFAPLVVSFNEEVTEYWWNTVNEVVNHALTAVQTPDGVPDIFLSSAEAVSINNAHPVMLELTYSGRGIGTDPLTFPIQVTVPVYSQRRFIADIETSYKQVEIKRNLQRYQDAVDSIKKKVSDMYSKIRAFLGAHSSTGQMLKAANEWDREILALAIDAFFTADNRISMQAMFREELYTCSRGTMLLPVGLGFIPSEQAPAKLPAKLQSRPFPKATRFLAKPSLDELPQPIDEKHRRLIEQATEVNNALEKLFETMGEDCVLEQSSKRNIIDNLTGPILQSALS